MVFGAYYSPYLLEFFGAPPSLTDKFWGLLWPGNLIVAFISAGAFQPGNLASTLFADWIMYSVLALILMATLRPKKILD